MRHRSFLALCLICSAVRCQSQEIAIITTFVDDTRLAAPITLHMKNTSLGDALKEIGSQTGTAVTASREIAEDGCTIFVKKLAAGDVLARLGSLFEYEWERRGEAQNYRYTLVMPGRTRTKMLALKNRERQLQLEWVQKHIDAVRPYLAHGYPAVARDRDRLKAEADATSDPARKGRLVEPLMGVLGLLHELETFAAAYVAANLTPAQWNALFDGETLTASTTPGRDMALPRAFQDWLSASHAEFAARESDRPPPRQDPIRRQSSYRSNISMQIQWAPGGGIIAAIKTSVTVVRDGSSQVNRSAKSVTWPNVQLHEKPRTKMDWSPDLTATRKDTELGDVKLLPSQRTASRKTFADVLEHLAGMTDYGIVADAYWMPTQASMSSANLRDAAMQLAQSGKSDVRRDGNFLLFRNGFWYDWRFREIPRALIDRLAKRMNESSLTIDDIAELTALSRDQLDNLRSNPLALRERAPLPELVEWLASPRFETLRLYASLSADQRRKLAAGHGIGLVSLTSRQQALFVAAVDLDASGSVTDTSPPQTIGVQMVYDGSGGLDPQTAIYRFVFYGGEREIRRVQFNLPRPKKLTP